MTKLESLKELGLADAVFLPIPLGEKGPKLTGWNTKTLADMEDPSYLAMFEGDVNVGVLLGKPSSGLCSIDVDSDQDYAAFLACNPTLAESLQTKGVRGGNLWVKIQGEFPPLSKIAKADGSAWGEFRANGGQTVIQGRHPNGKDYEVVVRQAPVQIAFQEIHWPEGLSLPWIKSPYEVLVEQEGEPFQYGESNKLSLNEPSIVAKFAYERLTIFESDERNFYQYEPGTGLWAIQTEDQIKRQFSQDLKRAADELSDARILVLRTSPRLSSLVSQLKGHVGVQGVFDKKQAQIHCQNGTLDLSVSPPEFKTFSPDAYSRNATPIAYDPAAVCPRFLNELLAVALDEEDISLLQRVGGAMLLGRNAAQRFLLITGTAGGGKSTVVSIIEKIIGLKNVAQLRTEQLDGRFEFYAFLGKTLLAGKDVAADFLQCKSTHKLKALVGSDFLQCEKKNAGHFPMKGDFNVLITCNTRLRIRLEGDVEAWERRTLVISYDKSKVAQPIVDFDQVLMEQEGPGILNFFVEGAQQHLQELQETGNYRLSPKQIDRTRTMMRESDSVRQFVEQGTIAAAGASLSSQELLAAYFVYCEHQGWTPYDASNVAKKLPALMMERHKVSLRHDIVRDGKDVRGYRHVALIQEAQ